MSPKPIILFDGVCNLCNSAVQFVLKHDKKDQFRFASLQGSFGQQFLATQAEDLSHLKTFILIEDEKVFTQSTAALRVAKKLSFPINGLYGLIIVPAFIRNGVYKLVSKNRYRWFGKKDSCLMPTAALQYKFLA